MAEVKTCKQIGVSDAWGDPAPAGSARFRRAARRKWLDKFGPHCPLCDCVMVFEAIVGGPRFQRMATLDHILARGLGGTNALDNLCFICRRCNQEKAVRESILAQRRVPVAQPGEAADLKVDTRPSLSLRLRHKSTTAARSDALEPIFFLDKPQVGVAAQMPLHPSPVRLQMAPVAPDEMKAFMISWLG